MNPTEKGIDAKELKSRMVNTNLLHIYQYKHFATDALCAFVDMTAFDADEQGMDEHGEAEYELAKKELTDSLTVHYSDKYVNSLRLIEWAMIDEHIIATAKSIDEHYRTLAADYVDMLVDTANDKGATFLFSFLPKSL